jgi:hypothetical protein
MGAEKATGVQSGAELGKEQDSEHEAAYHRPASKRPLGVQVPYPPDSDRLSYVALAGLVPAAGLP